VPGAATAALAGAPFEAPLRFAPQGAGLADCAVPCYPSLTGLRFISGGPHGASREESRPRSYRPWTGKRLVLSAPCDSRALRASPQNRASRNRRRRLVQGHTHLGDQPPAELLLPAVGYLPARPEAVSRSLCEWKGEAVYFDVVVGAQTLSDVAWSYPDPNPAFRSLRDHVAFYAWPFDGCFVDDERVTPQPGNFYGGWITSDIAGPFKGPPGTWSW